MRGEAVKLTKPQILFLQRANLSDDGVLRSHRHDSFGTINAMGQRLVDAGMMTKYRHGGFEITDAGRAALKELLK